ncbi:hypothetical protein [Agromyces seonyuensis]|uniref:DUF2975 domain-containing protein n=1 Tax=Agromyces seonyuensis TaxID=2662446 RepID=A0A6I4NY36_9MICO|nr:hypothetical protein [Agromyces seonyuensis]MWB99081.1 hypothetical protein [Agromyces seonyuensis]
MPAASPATTPSIATTARLGRADRIALRGIIGLVVAWCALLVAGALYSLKQKLVDGLYSFAFPNTSTGRTVDLVMPDGMRLESAYAGGDLQVTAVGFGPTVVWLQVAIHVLGIALAVGIAVAAILLGRHLAAGRPFLHSMTVALTALALLLVIGGSAVEVLDQLCQNVARAELVAADPDGPLAGGWAWTFTGIWLFAGIAVGLVAGAFHIGERLQRDTDGLV